MKQQIKNAQSFTFSQKWDLLVKNIVKPPIKAYGEEDLGQSRFALKGRTFNREDHQIQHEGKTIDVSLYSSAYIKKYVILYLHSNASNKLQSVQLLSYLPQNYILACFDFIGCGINSIQTPISLGVREAAQTSTVVEYLKNKGYQVAIWGRSMGAVTALLYGNVKVIVADSPFVSFKSVCRQIAIKYSPGILKPIFMCLFCCIFCKLRDDIQKQGHYDPQQLDIMRAINQLDQRTVLILMAANNDEVVSQDNSRILYRKFKGSYKHLQLFEGTHNSKRPKYVIQKVINIIQTTFERQQKQESRGHVQLQMQSTNSQRLRMFSKSVEE